MHSLRKLLTIAIPTYNRTEFLLKNIEYVLPQLNDKCKLLIIDNHSTDPVKDKIQGLINKYPQHSVEIVRNKANIGLFANIVRCFEICDTKWLYILGDDDRLYNNGIEIILNDIKKNIDFYNISYKWEPEKKWNSKRPISTCDFKNYVTNIESIHHILFLSSNVYNAEILKDFISQGYYYQMNGAPHLSMLLLALDNKNGQILLSDNYIVDNRNSEVENSKRWDKPEFYRNVKLLLDLPFSHKGNFVFNQLFIKSYSLLKLLFYFLMEYEKNNDKNEFLKNYKLSTSYYLIYEKRFFYRLFYIVLRIVIRLPRLLIFLKKIYKF